MSGRQTIDAVVAGFGQSVVQELESDPHPRDALPSKSYCYTGQGLPEADLHCRGMACLIPNFADFDWLIFG